MNTARARFEALSKVLFCYHDVKMEYRHGRRALTSRGVPFVIESQGDLLLMVYMGDMPDDPLHTINRGYADQAGDITVAWLPSDRANFSELVKMAKLSYFECALLNKTIIRNIDHYLMRDADVMAAIDGDDNPEAVTVIAAGAKIYSIH